MSLVVPVELFPCELVVVLLELLLDIEPGFSVVDELVVFLCFL